MVYHINVFSNLYPDTNQDLLSHMDSQMSSDIENDPTTKQRLASRNPNRLFANSKWFEWLQYQKFRFHFAEPNSP